MNWKKWLAYDPYKKLWSLVGSRPWTYISRDIYHKAEYVVLVGLFTAGFFLGKSELVSMGWFLVIMIAYTIGFIHGHFFGGKKYIPGETADRRRR